MALGNILVAVTPGQAQQEPAIGFLYPGSSTTMALRIAALRDGLSDGGIREANNIEILGRSSDGNPGRLAPLAAELVQRKVAVLVSVGASGIKAAREATSAIAILAHNLETDPIASGYVASLARPGGNITGVFADFPELGTKWLELMKEAIPRLSEVVVFRDPKSTSTQLTAVEAAARMLSVKLKVQEVPSAAELPSAFRTVDMRSPRPDAIIVLASPIFGSNPRLLGELAFAHRIPLVSSFADVARAGGLFAYGPRFADTYRQLGRMVAKVLQGTRPADLPVERPTKFQMVLNLKTARVLGLALPELMVQRADEVIE